MIVPICTTNFNFDYYIQFSPDEIGYSFMNEETKYEMAEG